MRTKRWMLFFAAGVAGMACQRVAAQGPAEKGFAVGEPLQGYKEVSRQGMTFRWKVDGAWLHCVLRAPTTGWVTLGFNERDAILGADLIMTRVVKGKAEVVDRFVRGFGDAPLDQAHGGVHSPQDIGGWEKDGQTQTQFKIPIAAKDPHDKVLREGQSIWVILAFAQVDDYEHHSLVRVHVKVTL